MRGARAQARKRVCIHRFIFVFFLYFFYNSSCRKDQFTVLSLKFGSQDFTDPARSTKYPVDIVVVVLPSQVYVKLPFRYLKKVNDYYVSQDAQPYIKYNILSLV